MEQNTIDTIIKIATLAVPIGAVFVGIGLERFKARYTVLGKNIEINKIGASLSDVNYGEIEIKYQGNEIKGNLLFLTATLINSSWTSIPELTIKYGFLEHVTILQSRSFLIFDENTYELVFSEAFNSHFKKTFDDGKLEEKPANYSNDLGYVTRHREYITPYLNKGQKIVTEFLIETGNQTENVMVLPLKENIKIVGVNDEETIKRNRMNYIHLLASVFYIATAIILFCIDITKKESIWVMLINSLTCYLFAWTTWFIVRYVRYVFVK
ncbi:hypothetical protein [Pedobacter sp. MR22-3]|uniref:hypothetical protein n=1 Tax=Pedobacter sp. MR22-3 TaxID=2994552 RepID=UPI00224682A5|nr:hypothetical protein [Pedobacter sp. MR22-3]MCX2583907.1 hypothetical protein [Pedobacter sp. MR22-3]